MAKLNQLIMLENMMKTYDAMNIKDVNLTHFQGVCTEKLVDEINGRLEKLVVSKVRMSCRNVLLVGYEKLRKYLFQHFGELTHEQHIAMFEYDVQMNQIREEIKKYQKQLPIKDKDMNNINEEMKKETGEFHIHVYSTGNNIAQTINQTINGNVYYGRNVAEKPKATDEQVAQALTNIVGKGKPIDSKQKWTGALWMLHWMCGYPIKAQEFCTRIEQLPLPADLEFKCDYRNIRELATLSFIFQDATQMDKVVPSKNDTPVFQQMRTVALAVAQELRAVTGQRD